MESSCRSTWEKAGLCLPNVRLHGAGLHVAVKNKDHDGHEGEDNDQVQQEGLPGKFSDAESLTF